MQFGHVKNNQLSTVVNIVLNSKFSISWLTQQKGLNYKLKTILVGDDGDWR